MSGDSVTQAPAGSAQDWPLRPWILATLLAAAGLLVHLFSDHGDNVPWRMAATAFFVFAPLAFALTLRRGDYLPSGIFGAIVGLIMAGIAWRATAAGDSYSDSEYWIAAGVLAVTLSVPLFQAGFHQHRWKTSYLSTHYHVWSDAICGAGALAFVGLSWALIAVLAELFDVIQISFLKDLIDEEWFGWIFSGAAFGAALGVLRNQLKIIGTLQSVVMLVLSILAVPLAIALVLFLLAVLFSGIDVLWEATRSATPLLLAIAIGCFILANAVVRDRDEDASQSKILRLAGFILALGILPLSVMAALSMGTRIAQHGLSPERIWALIAIAVAVAYGVGYFVAALRGRKDGWQALLRQSNLHLAVMTCIIALLLAMPILNFGAISTNNQLARLQSGAVSAEDFDYAALRWDFGEPGRKALAELEKSENAQIAERAKAAQQMDYRYAARARDAGMKAADKALIEIADEQVRQATRTFILEEGFRCRDGCRIVELRPVEGGILLALLNTNRDPDLLLYKQADNRVVEMWIRNGQLMEDRAMETQEMAPDAKVELRPFTGQQLYIDGKPASGAFE